MIITKKIQFTTAIVASLFAIGCQTTGGPSAPKVQSQVQKDQAERQWNAARSSVMGGLALEQFKSGNFEKCQASLDEALRMSPENADLHILSAKLAIELGKLEKAASELELARKLSPTNAESEYLDGVVLQRWQQPQKACDAYAAAVKKNPQELAYLMAESEMLVALKKPDAAAMLLQEKLSYFEHSAAIRDALGQLLVQRGKFADGVALLREASVLASEDESIREHLAFGLFNARQYNDAAEVFSRLLKDDANAKRADLFGALGECQSQSGLLRAANETFEVATQLEPACAGYWLALGKTRAELKDLKNAELAVRRAVSLDPANGEAHCLLGYVRLRENQLPLALSAFHTASQIDTTDTVSICMQGYVLKKMGQSDQATQLYLSALKIKPNDELASRLLASADVND